MTELQAFIYKIFWKISPRQNNLLVLTYSCWDKHKHQTSVVERQEGVSMLTEKNMQNLIGES